MRCVPPAPWRCLLALLFALHAGCTPAPAPVSSTSSPDSHAGQADAVADRIEALRLAPATQRAVCERALDALDAARSAGREAEAELGPCTVAVTLARGAEVAPLLRRFAAYLEPEARAELLLEAAARTGSAGDLVAASDALLDLAGYASGAPFDNVDAETFWAARGALRGPAAEDAAARARLASLEAFEFPLGADAAQRGALMDLYFRRWPDDTVVSRRLIGGFAIGWRDICAQWETGIASVQFNRGLAAMLSPVRAEIPGRLMRALPHMGAEVAAAAQAAASSNRGVEGALHQGLLAWNGVKRDFDVAVSVASATGRDAGITAYQAVGSCRSVRGLRLTDALMGAFEFYGARVPTAPAVASQDARKP